MFKKILIIRIGNIGDVLFATPLIRVLRKNYPQAVIDIVTSPQAHTVVALNPYINNIFIYRKFPRLQRIIRRKLFISKLKKNHYDLCVLLESNREYTEFAYQACPKSLRIGIESNFSGKVLHRTVDFSIGRHAIENYLLVASKLLSISLTSEDYGMDFFIPEMRGEFEKKIKQPAQKKFFIVHSSCSKYLPYRGWDMEKFAEVIRYLITHDIDVFITGAANDEEPKKLLELMRNQKGVFAFLGRSLYEVAYLIKHSKGILCCDTGILHLAMGLNVPCVALFGPSNPHHTGPIGNGQYRVIRKNFSCGPCHYNPQYHAKEKEHCMDGRIPRCMKAITSEEVISLIKSILL